MNSDTVKKLLDEFYPQLEALETRCTAIQQFLTDQRLATDEQLAPYLERAGKTSSVKWLANRLRMEYLLTSAVKELETDENSAETAEKHAETASTVNLEEDNEEAPEKAALKAGLGDVASEGERRNQEKADSAEDQN